MEDSIRERTDELESEKDKFRAIAEGVDDLIALLDVDGKFLYVNHAYNQAMFGEEHTILGISCFRDIHPDDIVLARKTFDEIVSTGISKRVEYRFVPVGGRDSYIESVASAIRDTSGNVSKLVVVSRDITKRKRDEQERANEHRRLELVVTELKQRNRESDALAKMADELQICDTMDKAYRVVKKYSDKLFPVAFGSMNILSEADNRIEEVLFWGKSKHREALFTKDQCLAMVRGGSHLVENPHNDLLCHHAANCDRPYLCLPMIAQGELIGVLHLQFSITNDSRVLGGQGIGGWLQSQQRRALSIAEHLALAIANLKLRNTLRTEAIRDPLTGLFNKRYMQENLGLEIKRCERNSRMLGLLLLDIDHFKRFNDEFGHEAGDLVLSEVGGFLREKVRSSDMACRYGGEEFLILLTDTTRDGVVQLADKLREGVKQLKLMHNGTKLPDISFSLGIAFLPDHGKDVKELLDAADKALYRAKDSGRDRVEIAH